MLQNQFPGYHMHSDDRRQQWKKAQLFRGLFRIFSQDLRNGMREIETVAVRLETQGFDFGDALDALLVQVVFERQSSLLNNFGGGDPTDAGRRLAKNMRLCHKYN